MKRNEKPAVIIDEAMWEALFDVARQTSCQDTQSVLLAILGRLKRNGNTREAGREIFKEERWRRLRPDPANNQSRWCASFNATIFRRGMPYRIGGRVGVLIIDTISD